MPYKNGTYKIDAYACCVLTNGTADKWTKVYVTIQIIDKTTEDGVAYAHADVKMLMPGQSIACVCPEYIQYPASQKCPYTFKILAVGGVRHSKSEK